MEFRKHLLGGQVAVAALTVVTVVMALVALHKTASRASIATTGAFDDIALLENARAHVAELTDATRTYLLERHDERRAGLADVQKRLEPVIDELAVRAQELGVPDAWRIERDADAYVAWLSGAAADVMAVEPFEYQRATRRVALEAELNAFAVTARNAAAAKLDSATALAQRAQFGVIFTAAMSVLLGLVLAANALRKIGTQLRRLRHAANLANRNAAARSELLEVAGAELRTAANAIGLGTALLDESRLRDADRPHLARIRSATHRLERVLDNVRDASELAAADQVDLHYERCNSRAVIGTCIDMFLPMARDHGVHLKADTQDIVIISADRERLLQILLTLVGHAISRTQAGGFVVLKAAADDAGARFEVSDTGPMLAPEARARAFTRMRTSSGTWLALDVCRRLVEAHRGHAGVESNQDQTTFWFFIPN
jgi:signal transduction histidine kinase